MAKRGRFLSSKVVEYQHNTLVLKAKPVKILLEASWVVPGANFLVDPGVILPEHVNIKFFVPFHFFLSFFGFFGVCVRLPSKNQDRKRLLALGADGKVQSGLATVQFAACSDNRHPLGSNLSTVTLSALANGMGTLPQLNVVYCP